MRLNPSQVKGGDFMRLFPHQEQVLDLVKNKNRVAFYLDMGLG